MDWWMWVLLGLALLAFEVATPGGLVALFFGAGALVVAPVAAAGAGRVVQWLLFSAVSLAALALLRGHLLARLDRRPSAPVDAIVGQEVVLLEDVPPGGEGKAELRGVPWSARAAAGGGLRAGQRYRVERVDGVTLWLRAE
jgi:membrane protein implicated in regulation of membrane protease activity